MAEGTSSHLNPHASTFIPDVNSIQRMRCTSFPQLILLEELIILHILEFVGDVPYESSTYGKESTLTHVLPLVSKSFYSLSGSDYLWKKALHRLVENEPSLWGDALNLFLLHNPVTLTTTYENDGAKSNEERLVNNVTRTMEQLLLRNSDNDVTTTPAVNSSPSRELYRVVLSNYIRYTSPLFYMPDDVQLGKEFGLHFFEPRYRLLIAEVMAPYPDNFKEGDPITADRTGSYPTFIYAHKSPLKRGTVACLVQVRQCVIHQNHTADIFLMPVSYVRIERFWERPTSHNLYEARVMRMGKEEGRQVDQASRGFTNSWDSTSEMNQLIHHLLMTANANRHNQDG
mmetsp:Transcript_23028/g.28248  ORF Transcript_23028/g.28248 Transcript_23028/m.28248 type:complete len:343 (-) Transcript_23028:137-1165(-)